MSKRKPKISKANKALTISIHGKGIDIDARFEDANLGELVGTLAERVNNGGIATPPIVERPSGVDASQPVVALIAELAKTIRPDQLAAIQPILDPTQMVIAMEILNIAVPPVTSRNDTAQAAAQA